MPGVGYLWSHVLSREGVGICNTRYFRRVCPGGRYVQEAGTPPGYMEPGILWDMVEKRAVRILLECNISKTFRLHCSKVRKYKFGTLDPLVHIPKFVHVLGRSLRHIILILLWLLHTFRHTMGAEPVQLGCGDCSPTVCRHCTF